MSERFTNKVAVVTGGASGIGAATVRRLVSEGASVVIADLQEQATVELADELGPATSAHIVDVTDLVRAQNFLRLILIGELPERPLRDSFALPLFPGC